MAEWGRSVLLAKLHKHDTTIRLQGVLDVFHHRHGFAIQKIAGHSTITISQRYVHPTEEKVEDAFSRLERYNAKKVEELELKRRASIEVQVGVPVPPESPTDDQD